MVDRQLDRLRDAQDIQFTRVGSGEPLVLVHGIGSSRHVWDPVLAKLATERDVIAVDLPGFGMSAMRQVEPSVAGYADAIARFLGELDIEGPHIAGHSFGGAVALELGRRGIACSIAAFGPIGFWGASGSIWCQSVLRMTRSASRKVRPALPALARPSIGKRATASLFYGRPTQLRPSHIVADADAFLGGHAFEPVLDEFGEYVFGDLGALIETPISIVWGDRDRLLPAWSQSRRARVALPHATHVRVAGGGHVVMADDPATAELVLLGRWRRPTN